MVFGTEVFKVSTSVWVADCSVRSVAIVWRFVGGCGCSIWAVVRTCSSAVWDEPSVGGSFPTLFLGGILWVFFRAHKWWVPMLGLDNHEAVEHQRVWDENDEHDM
jgi:hypothetical protein